MIPIFDLHQDLITVLRIQNFDPWSGQGTYAGHGNLQRLKQSGYKLVVQAAFSLQRYWGEYLTENPVLQALRAAERLHELVETYPDQLVLVKNRHDLETLMQGDRLGFLLAYEGLYGVEDRWTLRALYRAGFRILGLTWNVSNLVATGAWDSVDRGLSGLGRDLLQRADELGFLLDLAHASPKTYDEVLALPLKRPPLVSHTGVLPEAPQTPRNISLERARQVVQRGGIVGLALAKLFFEDPNTTIEEVAGRVQLLLQEIPEGVASGSDFFGFGPKDTIEGLEGVEGLRNLEQVLRRQGVSEDALANYLYRNALRYLRAYLPEA